VRRILARKDFLDYALVRRILARKDLSHNIEIARRSVVRKSNIWRRTSDRFLMNFFLQIVGFQWYFQTVSALYVCCRTTLWQISQDIVPSANYSRGCQYPLPNDQGVSASLQQRSIIWKNKFDNYAIRLPNLEYTPRGGLYSVPLKNMIFEEKTRALTNILLCSSAPLEPITIS
jgi:hypothetical protein